MATVILFISLMQFLVVPSEPQLLEVVSVNSTFVTLKWSPPDTSNGVITQYSIQFDATVINNFGSNMFNMLELMGTVEGLSPDTMYLLRLRAHTRVGAGPPSSVTVMTSKLIKSSTMVCV